MTALQVLIVCVCCFTFIISPATDRENVLRSIQREFIHCINMVMPHFSQDVVANANVRLARLRLDVLSARNVILNDGEIEEIVGILDECLRELSVTQPENALITTAPFRAPIQERSGRGRPYFNISQSQLNLMLSYGFQITDIADTLHVSARTITRRMSIFGIQRPQFSEINDTALDNHVQTIIGANRLIGPNTVRVRLANISIRVQRERVRQAMHRVDPVGFAVRRTRRIERRQYRVNGPNSLWHLDGNHKLVTWRLVVHGAIDGHTRVVTFCNVASNNFASTVLDGFLEGVAEYGMPSRLRCDAGGENILVAQCILAHRGSNRGSVIVGPSTRNQRIERLWGDVWRHTVNLYYDLFLFMEHEHILDPSNDMHLYALHYVFIPRIQQSMQDFKQYWNNHGIRTARHFSPHQLFISESLQRFGSAGCAIQDIFHNHGGDPTENVNAERNATHPVVHADIMDTVVVPPIPELLTPAELATLREQVDPLNNTSGDTLGIAVYLRTLTIIRDILTT